MSKAQLVITAVVLEGRSESEVAHDYDVSRYCVQQLVKRYETEGVAAFEHTPAAPTTIPGRPAPSSRKRSCGCAKPWTNKVPGGRHATVLLDIANTGVARGKVYAARERGERLPDGWAIDASGLPTNDPQAALDGLILPMSGHKGYAISFMMDVLSGVLTGSACGADVVGPYVPDKRSGCGHLVIALNIAAIMPLERFTQRIDKLITTLKSSRTAPGQEILIPGEIENRSVTAASGMVALPAKTVDELNGLAAGCGVDPLVKA